MAYSKEIPGLRQAVGRYHMEKSVKSNQASHALPSLCGRVYSLWSSFIQQDRVVMRETSEFGPGQLGLYAAVDLRPGESHLRFVNVSVDAADLRRNIEVGLISNLSIMDETRNYKSLALGPARLLNVSLFWLWLVV